MATLVNLTGNIADLIGTDFDARRTRVWVTTNLPDDVIIDATGNEVRLGDAYATVDSAGLFTFTGLWATNAATNPTAFQYQLHIDYPKRSADRGRKTWDSGWFSLTTTSDIADVVQAQYVPPTWMTTATATLQTYVDDAEAARDAAVDISNISTSDDVVEALVLNTGGAGPKTSGALSATYARAVGVSVKNHGAVGDGVTSDHAAFQAARDAAGVDGTVIVPPGRYVLNGLLLNKSNQRWVLEKDAVLTVADGVTQNVLNIGANGIRIDGPGELDGNRGGGANAAGIYDTLGGATDIVIEDLTVRETLGYGIQLYGSRCAVRRSRFFNTKGAAVLYVAEGTHEASDGEIVDCYVDRSNEAVTLTDAALWIGGNATYPFRRAVIANNIVKMPRNPTNSGSSPICIELTSADGGTITGNATEGGSMGISLGNGSRTTISGNVVRGWNWWGIEVAGSLSENVVDGNVVDGDGIGGSSWNGAGGNAGIVTNDSVQRTIISNNVVFGLDSGLATPIRGIQLQSTSRGELVTGNLLYVPEYGISTGGDCTLIGNVIRKEGATASQGILVTTSGGLGPGTQVSVIGGEIKGFLDGVKLDIVGGNTGDNVIIEGVRFVSCTNPYTTATSGGGAIGTNIVRRNNLPSTANSAISETALATLGGGALIDNNTALRWKDSGGTSRRIGLVTSGNAMYFGDVDNALAAADLLLAAGGTGFVKLNQNGSTILSVRSSGAFVEAGDVRVLTAGQGFRIKEGANARMGVATLVAGTVTVSNTSVGANTRILLSVQSLGTVTAPKAIGVTARVAGTSFTITSADATDTSVVAWELIEPA